MNQIQPVNMLKEITDLFNQYNPSSTIDYEATKASFLQLIDNYKSIETTASLYKEEEPSDGEERFKYCVNFWMCADEDLDSDFKEVELEPTFSEILLFFIYKKKLRNAKVYKTAQIDRRHFSKIVSNRDYKPTRDTVIRFVFALKLNLDDADYLMETAGFAFSRSSLRDVVFEYFINKEKYDIDSINEVLYGLNLELLTGKK